MLNPSKMIWSDSAAARSFVLWGASADAYAYEIQDFNGRLSYLAVVNGQTYTGKAAFMIARNIASMYLVMQAARAQALEEQRRAMAMVRDDTYPEMDSCCDRIKSTRRATSRRLMLERRQSKLKRIQEISAKTKDSFFRG